MRKALILGLFLACGTLFATTTVVEESPESCHAAACAYAEWHEEYYPGADIEEVYEAAYNSCMGNQ